MADKSNPSDPAKPSGRQPRRPRTIDVEATDVTPKTSVASSAASAASSAESEPSYTEAPKTGTAWLPSGGIKAMLSAAAVGAIGMLILIAVLWSAGIIGGGSANDPGRMAAGEVQPRERAGTPRNDVKPFDELAMRIERLEKNMSSPPAPLADPALANRLAAADNATKSVADDVGGLSRRLEELTAAVAELRTRADAVSPIDKSEFEAMSNRIAALEKSAGTMESEIGKRATITSDRAVRLALATSALRAAVERGEPFTGELAAARPLAPDDAFTALEPFAATGVPSNAALARELAGLVPALRTAASAAPPDAGFLDRLKISASRLVRIRPAEESGSDDPTAVINRIESKATMSDVPGALLELAKLPQVVRAPAQAWMDKAEARNVAVATSRRLAADAIGGLGKAVP